MSLPNIVSYGSGAKTSTLVWDSDLTIPDGYAIESATGEVGIIGDVSISGGVSTDGSISGGGDITAAGNLVAVNAVLSDKALVFCQNVGNASVTLADFPYNYTTYTSPDFAITNAVADVAYLIPPITFNGSFDYGSCNVSLQAKLTNGTYQTITSFTINDKAPSRNTGYRVMPLNTTALRYVSSARNDVQSMHVLEPFTLNLTPIPVY